MADDTDNIINSCTRCIWIAVDSMDVVACTATQQIRVLKGCQSYKVPWKPEGSA